MSVITKCDGWPKVLKFDDGIRPVTGPDRCCYCQQSVGSPHGRDCVTVTKLVRFSVMCQGAKVGVYREHMPHDCTVNQMEFMRNCGSWCANNAYDRIEWSSDADRFLVDDLVGDDEDACPCGIVSFEVEEVEDDGPFVKIRTEKEFWEANRMMDTSRFN